MKGILLDFFDNDSLALYSKFFYGERPMFYHDQVSIPREHHIIFYSENEISFGLYYPVTILEPTDMKFFRNYIKGYNFSLFFMSDNLEIRVDTKMDLLWISWSCPKVEYDKFFGKDLEYPFYLLNFVKRNMIRFIWENDRPLAFHKSRPNPGILPEQEPSIPDFHSYIMQKLRKHRMI